MTDQPRSFVPDKAVQLDEITVFLGDLPPEEYEQRRRILAARRFATFKATQTESPTALQLCRIVTDTATEWGFAPSPIDALAEVAQFLRRLLTVADQAEAIEATL